MVGLSIYLGCVGLVVLGVFGISNALAIPGRFRMFLSAMVAAGPILLGIWLFRSSGLQPGDFPRLVPIATREVRDLLDALKEAQKMQAQERAHMDPEVRRELQRVYGK